MSNRILANMGSSRKQKATNKKENLVDLIVCKKCWWTTLYKTKLTWNNLIRVVREVLNNPTRITIENQNTQKKQPRKNRSNKKKMRRLGRLRLRWRRIIMISFISGVIMIFTVLSLRSQASSFRALTLSTPSRGSSPA